jgi:hypothetical protein
MVLRLSACIVAFSPEKMLVSPGHVSMIREEAALRIASAYRYPRRGSQRRDSLPLRECVQTAADVAPAGPGTLSLPLVVVRSAA